MNTPDRTMIRRTEVQMMRTKGMPFYTYACPFCGTEKNVQVHGEHECEKCSAPLLLVKPRKTG